MENIKEKRILFLCDCTSAEHQIIIHHDQEDNLVYATIHLKKLSFWKRLMSGIRYIFGYSCKYGNFEEFIWDKADAERLENVIEALKSK